LLYRGAIIAFLENPKEVIQVLPVVKPNLMCTVPRFFEKTYQGIVDEVAKWPAAKRKIFSWAVSVGHQVSDYRAKGATPPGLLGLKHRLADKLVLSKLRNIFGGQIKVMPCAGAAIPVDILKFFHAVGIFVNFGYGLTETMATVSCLRSDTYDLESCGSIMPEVEVMIGAGGEILVRGKSVFQGYYKDPDYTASVMREGWFHTGDEGFLTPNGDLVMTDRIKDLMKTSVGKYVSPQKLEMLLAQDEHVDQIIVVGDNRKFVTALVVPVMDKLKSFAQIHGIDWQDEEALCQQPQVLEMLKLRFDQLQAGLSPYERVVHFALLPKAFSIEAGTMTSTLKLRRRAIEKRFAPLIEQMYSKA
jgi:long-chain acyl-CoA synthetase